MKKCEQRSNAWDQVTTAVLEGDPEATLSALANWFEVDRSLEDNDLVKGLLQSCADSCRHAAMDYYVSLK